MDNNTLVEHMSVRRPRRRHRRHRRYNGYNLYNPYPRRYNYYPRSLYWNWHPYTSRYVTYPYYYPYTSLWNGHRVIYTQPTTSNSEQNVSGENKTMEETTEEIAELNNNYKSIKIFMAIIFLMLLIFNFRN